MRRGLGILLVATALAGTGCDDDVPVTPQALAYVAADHTGTPTSASSRDVDWFDAFDDDAVAAELRYHQTEDDYGDTVTVTLGTLDRPELTDCDETEGLYR